MWIGSLDKYHLNIISSKFEVQKFTNKNYVNIFLYFWVSVIHINEEES